MPPTDLCLGSDTTVCVLGNGGVAEWVSIVGPIISGGGDDGSKFGGKMVLGAIGADLLDNIGAELVGDGILASDKMFEGFVFAAVVTLRGHLEFKFRFVFSRGQLAVEQL